MCVHIIFSGKGTLGAHIECDIVLTAVQTWPQLALIDVRHSVHYIHRWLYEPHQHTAVTAYLLQCSADTRTVTGTRGAANNYSETLVETLVFNYSLM